MEIFAVFKGVRVYRLNARYLAGPVLLALCMFVSTASAGQRVALLLGNSAYRMTASLANPPRDVTLIKYALEKAGFDKISVSLNGDRAQMIQVLREFETTVQGADIAIVYYSGHGMEMDGRNYLLPVDAKIQADRDVEDEAIALDRVQRAVEGATRLRMIILDACRNNPFEPEMRRTSATRAVSRGLARIEPRTADTLIAYAAKAGTVALDGDGNNSPFATALATAITEPGLDVRIALGKVRDDVMRVTQGKQEPFVYGSLGGSQVSLAKRSEPAEGTSLIDDKRAFEAARSVDTPEAYDAFIKAFPNSFYAAIAAEMRTKAAVKPGSQPEKAGPAASLQPGTATIGPLAAPPPAVEMPSGEAPSGKPAAKVKRPARAPRVAGKTQTPTPGPRRPKTQGSANCFVFNGATVCN